VAREVFHRREGRSLFGQDPTAYERARPGHAERVYELLVARCGLGPGSRVLEIGPGTGQATRRLLDLGAAPLVGVEPDPALAAFLVGELGDRVELHIAPLEDVSLELEVFDLAAAASSFHWIDEDVGLDKVFCALRPGGWFALWWTLFGDAGDTDAFIAATSPLLEGLARSPTAGKEGRPAHARDTEERVAALERAGFEQIEHELVTWRAEWDARGIRGLYSTFSPIARLDEARRVSILDGIERIAREDFDGRVERTLDTVIYTARRPDSSPAVVH